MQKKISKILSLVMSGTLVLGMAAAAGCSNYKGSTLTGDTSGAVTSNGGFLVQKGNYIYFVNGVASNEGNNTYGVPVKGSIMRISSADFAAGKYAKAEIVVPQIAYAGNYNAGIYVYGDRVYYSTPSTAKDTDGNIQNNNIEFKSAPLNGSSAMRNSYLRTSEMTLEYRYVEVDNTVYLIYATKEDYFDTGVTTSNIHSINLSTNKDNLLAYNVKSYLFDSEPTAPYVYYTMSVDVNGGDYGEVSNARYEQVYSVRADATLDKSNASQYATYTNDDNETNVKYLNTGKLLIDGIGKGNVVTAYNMEYQNGSKALDEDTASQSLNYLYTLDTVNNGEMIYARTNYSSSSSNSVKEYYRVDMTAQTIGDANLFGNSATSYLTSASYAKVTATDYIFVDDASITTADGSKADVVYLNTEGGTNGLYKANIINGELKNEVFMDKSMTGLSIYKMEMQQADGDTSARPYLYYADGTGNGNSLCRIALDGSQEDYRKASAGFIEDKSFTAVKVLDIATVVDWYAPEFVGDHFVFASEISATGMDNYEYIQVFDLRNKEGNKKLMSNAQLADLSDLYNDLMDEINDIEEVNAAGDATDYANLINVEKYFFFSTQTTAEKMAYLDEILNTYVLYGDYTKAEVKDKLFSDVAKEALTAFANTTVNKTHTISYFYNTLGFMSSADVTAYEDTVRGMTIHSAFTYNENNQTWYQGLATWQKALFIVGMCLLGLLVLGGITVFVLWLVSLKKKKLPSYAKAKKKIDMTDDKNIDVYSTDEE